MPVTLLLCEGVSDSPDVRVLSQSCWEPRAESCRLGPSTQWTRKSSCGGK